MKLKQYEVAPEDSSQWKCNWLSCAGGMGLAGSGMCSFRGDWANKECEFFITEEDFEFLFQTIDRLQIGL